MSRACLFKIISLLPVQNLLSIEGLSWPWSYGSWIYNYLCNQSLSPLMLRIRILLRRGILDTTLCDQVCQWLVTVRWFSPVPPVFSTNKTDRHDITEILLKVALDTIKQTNKHLLSSVFSNKTAASAVWRLAWSRRVRYIVRTPRSGQIKDNTEDWHYFVASPLSMPQRLVNSESGQCVWLKRHVYPWTLCCFSELALKTNSTNRVGQVQSRHHYHFIECNLFLPWYNLKLLIWHQTTLINLLFLNISRCKCNMELKWK
jgi:hypothetical protein